MLTDLKPVPEGKMAAIKKLARVVSEYRQPGRNLLGTVYLPFAEKIDPEVFEKYKGREYK